ncbi:MAG: bifunctional UDP-N-acetylglucosamine diphosphorylase/glucosamine-1-phosphate N-acetyltransferase GlmU [Turicibacter sp.]
MKKYAVVLAAGKGTRMKSSLHKVLHPVLGKAMVDHAVSNLEKIGVEKIVTVIGYEAESVRNELKDRVEYAMQTEQLGTGHAVMMTKDSLGDLDGVTIVTYGDVPLLTEKTIGKLFDYHTEQNAAITVLTAIAQDPTGYGRIIRDEAGQVLKIVEQKDANAQELAVPEINTGVCVYDNKVLFEALNKITNNNSQGEYYLTDLVGIIRDMNLKVVAYVNEDFEETLGVNDRVQLAYAEKVLRKRVNEEHMRNGVSIIDPEATYIGVDAVIGQDVTIFPGTIISGHSVIGNDTIIGANSQILNSTIGSHTTVNASVIDESEVGDHTTVGPFAHIRMHSEIGNKARIGNFVEIKKSVFKDGAKSAHLSYIGDAELHENVNMGCGSITVNYDGKNKSKTVIGANTMVGCNVNLIAPVTIEANAYLAAGSTINKNVPEDAFAIARAKQVNKEGYAKIIREKM